MSDARRAVDEPLAPGPELERARLLTLRYFIASTVILGAAGMLGMLHARQPGRTSTACPTRGSTR